MAVSDITFPFPYKPYDVQEEFMKNLYSVLENSKIGIFESPTGTGKSLSIICGALKWLQDHKEKQKEKLKEIISEEVTDCGDDWFNSFLNKQEKFYNTQDAKKEYEAILEYENKIKNLKKLDKHKSKPDTHAKPNFKRQKTSDEIDVSDQTLEEEFVVEEHSDTEEEEKCEEKHVLKIYYASRTHSQLAQFLGEVKRSPYCDQVTVTTLGSRSNYCVNKSISKLKNLSLVNEHCIDLQRKKNSGKKCPYMRNLSDLQNSILSSVKDIEEIVQLGTETKCCPYYSTRAVIPDAEVVLLPYNVLLHQPTREAYGIILKNNVVIIDEAHNLVEAINNMYSAEIFGLVLQQSLWQLEAYHNVYQTRFSRDNQRCIKLLISLLKSFIKTLNTLQSSKIVTIADFLCLADMNVNVFELVKFCDKSLIGQKVHGFTAARVAKGISPLEDLKKSTNAPKHSSTADFLTQIKNRNNPVEQPKPETVKENSTQYKPSAIFSFIEFLKTLTSPTEDGRILINKGPKMEKSSLKFLHLNPASHFQIIVSESRSVVVAGGTMQPVDEFVNQLFVPNGVSKDKIHHFSCGHVIPQENLLAIGLASGPCGNTLDFTYKSRKLPQTIKELGSVLLNVCNTVRGGVVCFFPSYEYEDFIFSELNKSKMLSSIEKKCKVFREPKLSSDVDRVLNAYAKCIKTACSKTHPPSAMMGAVLFSIVGGKISEGINFSDDLGRCVIMVGLPYPNKFSVELQEKMAFLNQQNNSTGGKNAGDIYYNNLCMKAVNQSIGRAIRHKNDYAVILLLDYRYNNVSVKESLPNWILKSLSFHQKFGSAYTSLRQFFTARKSGS